MELNINGKPVDLDKAFPLRLGDFMDLQEAGLITEDNELKAVSAPDIAKLILHLARKVNADVDMDDVRTLDTAGLKEILDVLKLKVNEEHTPNRPT